MTRKIICTFLALVLCLSLGVTAAAEAEDTAFVVDEFDYLASEELDGLNELALSIYQQTGVGVFFVFTREQTLRDYDIGSLTGGMEDYFVMMENDTSWQIFKGGLGETIDTATEDALRGVYDETDTYVSGVENFLYAAAGCFPALDRTPEEAVPAAEENLLFDEADLLTDAEEEELIQKLTEVSRAYEAQIVVVTMASMGDGDIDAFVEYLYDGMGFGYGENYDGVLLLVCMDPREYRILSNGYAGVAIDPEDIGEISEEIVSNLSYGDYFGAFREFAEECAYYLEGYQSGFAFDVTGNLGTSLVIGVVIGLIVAFLLKGQLKTVRRQDSAHVYVKSDSMHVNVMNDIFLYRNVTRTKRESSSSSSGSRSSSGTARSKGGGSF